MQISDSKELYLEAIYLLSQKNSIVPSIDIANYLGYSKASVSIAIKELCKMHLVDIGLHKSIILTSQGKQIASQIHDKRCFFTSLLVNSGIEQVSAEQDACKLMHAISFDNFIKLRGKLCVL